MPIFASSSVIRDRLRHPLRTLSEFGRTKVNLPRPVNAVVRALQPRNLGRTAVLAFPQPGMAGESPVVRSAGGRLVAGVVGTVKNAFKPTTLSQLPKQIGAGIIGTSLPFIGYDIATSQGPAQFFGKLKNQSKEILALGISPIGGFLGLGRTYGQKIVDYGKETFKNAPTVDYLPQSPITNINFPEMPENLSAGYSGSMPSGVFAPSFGPSGSISAGGGDSGFAQLALLGLLGAGIGGYALGRRRRKRKYKKRRSRK